MMTKCCVPCTPCLQRFPDLDLDSLSLCGYAEVQNDWLHGLKRCCRLRSLDISRCTQVGGWAGPCMTKATLRVYDH